MRVGSPSAAMSEKWVNKHDPKQMRVWVFIPAGFPMVSRSMPMAKPHPMANTIFIIKNNHSRSLSNSSNKMVGPKGLIIASMRALYQKVLDFTNF